AEPSRRLNRIPTPWKRGFAPLGRGRAPSPHVPTCLEAADNTDTYVVVVLTASPGINVEVGNPGVEIARFDPPAPAMPRPHIQSRSELDYAGIGAAPRVHSAKNQIRGFPESSVATARANPRSDSLAGKNVHAQGWSHEQRRDVMGNLILEGV